MQTHFPNRVQRLISEALEDFKGKLGDLGGDLYLEGYATKEDLEAKADKTELEGLATKSELEAKANTSALTSLATKTELALKADKSELTALATEIEADVKASETNANNSEIAANIAIEAKNEAIAARDEAILHSQVNISAESDNRLELKQDGLYVSNTFDPDPLPFYILSKG